MIGQILVNEEPVLRMEDDGNWAAEMPRYRLLADYLNGNFHPSRNRQVGDSSSSYGVHMLYRAAATIRNGTVRLARPVPDIPEGATS